MSMQNSAFAYCIRNYLNQVCIPRNWGTMSELSDVQAQLAAANAEISKLKEKIAKLEGSNGKNVLLLGSGGREHAIAHKLMASSQVNKIYVAPGNGGTSSMGGKVVNVNVSSNDNSALIAFAQSHDIHLVAVGPEQPLVNGITDAMTSIGIPCFGPSAKAATIEASKAWSKDFMSRHNIRTAKYQNFTDFSKAKAYIESVDYRVVVKASGLAAGKGVILPTNKNEAIQAIQEIMNDKSFGSAGDEVVIEEFLEGEELSLLAFTDGKIAVSMPCAQDHKRIFDNDLGPNTGGMGAYAPAPIGTPMILKECMEIIQRTITGMSNEGNVYKGVLYTGFIITKDGPAVLEYNCRFGDPETQVLLPLLDSDIYEVMQACISGSLSSSLVKWKNAYACTVVVASHGYPDKYATGDKINGLHNAALIPNSTVYHAGTSIKNNEVVTSGGRVLAVTGIENSLQKAVSKAYEGVRKIEFKGMQYRKDIAKKGVNAPLRIGVIGSTRGTSLQPVIDAITNNTLNASIALVISNKKDAPILDRALAHGIKTKSIGALNKAREEYDAEVTHAFEMEGVQLILMVGYMRIVSAAFTEHWANRCMNVHPSLLPDFAGGMDLQVHADVIAAKKTISGCTVHYVTAEVDAGPIVVQKTCSVNSDETPESLKAKVQPLEGEAFIEAIKLFQNKLTNSSETITYAQAGVDIDAGEALVEAIKPMCKATRRLGCDADLGGFGGLFDLSQAGYDANETILVSGTDGVGTKLKIAQSVGKHDTIGIDLVAMCVNDILVCGAEPLFFLDYYATGALNVFEASQVVKGIAEGCLQSGSALIGGETAEMAGMYAKGEYDLAGFSVGAVRRSCILPKDVRSGDILIGIKSSGVHSNGYSLVRKCVDKSGLKWDDISPFSPGETLGNSLLTPTRIYVKLLLPLIKDGLLKAMAHITGGGLLDNLPRVLPDDIEANVDLVGCGWKLPPVFTWLQSIANLPMSELLRTFNCGIGMVLVVDPVHKEAVINRLHQLGERDLIMLGSLGPRTSVGSPQVVVKGNF